MSSSSHDKLRKALADLNAETDELNVLIDAKEHELVNVLQVRVEGSIMLSKTTTAGVAKFEEFEGPIGAIEHELVYGKRRDNGSEGRWGLYVWSGMWAEPALEENPDEGFFTRLRSASRELRIMAMTRMDDLEEVLATNAAKLAEEARKVRGDSIPLGAWVRFDDDWHTVDDYDGLAKTAIFRSGDQERRVRAIIGREVKAPQFDKVDKAMKGLRMLRGPKDTLHVDLQTTEGDPMRISVILEIRGPAIKFAPPSSLPRRLLRE